MTEVTKVETFAPFLASGELAPFVVARWERHRFTRWLVTKLFERLAAKAEADLRLQWIAPDTPFVAMAEPEQPKAFRTAAAMDREWDDIEARVGTKRERDT